MKKLLIILSILTVAMAMVAGTVFAKGMECKMDARGISVPTSTMADCCNSSSGKTCKMAAKASSAHVNDTPSIKEMQSKPCPKVCYTTIDPLGNKTATQTDNSGKNYLGR